MLRIIGLRTMAIVFILFYFIYVSTAISDRPCISVHESLGKCVNFQRCPPFFEMLKSAHEGYITRDRLRLLQRLTCGFKGNDPMICCPNAEVVRVTIATQSQDKIKTNNRKPVSVSSSPYPTPASKATSLKVPNQTGSNNSEINLRLHPNFGLIPSLKSCSIAVSSDRIVGGEEAGLGSYPWMARIGYLNIETDEVEFFCAGTIINSRYILTAAHCTEEIPKSYRAVVVRLGEYDITKKEDCSPLIGCIKAEDYIIEKIVPHEDYRQKDKSNDIELIRVNRNIPSNSLGMRPVCLPFKNEYSIEDVWKKGLSGDPSRPIKAWVAGWGKTRWNVEGGSNVLQEVQLPLVSNEQCSYNYSTRVALSDKQICAGGIKLKDSCGGDSGGPLMYPLQLRGDGKFFQIGIVSFGPVQCGQSDGLPGVYTRVSAYLKWILDNMEP